MKAVSDSHAPGGPPETARYRFDGIVVDAAAHTLSRGGCEQPLEPKAFAVLLALLRRPGELMVRDDLLDQVWGHRHVTPGVLTRAIAQLRAALDDDSQHPRYIQTQHALGYRFIGTLEGEEDASGASAAPSAVHWRDIAPPSDERPADAPLPPVAPAAVSGPPVAAEAARVPWWRRPRRIGALAALLLALVAAWWAPWRMHAPAMADASVAVLPFTSLSGDPADRYFAEGLAVEMHDALSGVPGLKVAALATGTAEDDDVRMRGARLGVASVLDASVRREGRRVRINARLSDTRTGFTLWSRAYDREAADVLALQSDIATEVVEAMLGHVPGSPRALQARFASTGDMEAYDSYLRGLAELQRPSLEGATDRAIAHFRAALQADAGFARAQAGICRAEINRLEAHRDAVAFGRARAACERAAAMDPSLREVNLAMAEIARVNGDHPQALQLYRQAMEDPSLRADALVGMARTHAAAGENAQAMQLFQQAAALRPGDAAIHSQLGYHHYLRGELDKAIAAYATATELRPNDSGLWSSLGGLYLSKGDTAAAGRAFSYSLSIEPNVVALSNLGTMKFEQGDYANAADMYRRAAELEPENYMVWGNLGDALDLLPDGKAAAREAYRRAARQCGDYVAVKADDAYAMAALAWYHANLGEPAQARAWLAKAEGADAQAGEVALWGAQALARLGDADGARARIARARREGIPEQRLATLPALRALAGAGRP